MEEALYHVIYTTLLAMCPRDTHNMVSNITIEGYDTHWSIKVSGPKMTAKGYYDYARAVNYNQRRSPKEERNYEWIERAIRQATEAVGGSVKYEIAPF